MAKSTKIIAALGVAGALGIAALPMASYAADPVTQIKDTISITVNPSCTFQAESPADAANGIYSETLANKGNRTFDAHHFNVFCNNATGYTVTAIAEGLTQDGVAADTTNKTNYIEYVAAADYATSGATGKWTAVVDGGNTGAVIDTTSKTIKSSDKSVDGTAEADKFNVTYKVYVGSKTDAGTYKGTVTYNLTANGAGA